MMINDDKKQTTWDNLNGKERQLKQVEKMLEYASQRPKKAFKKWRYGD